MQTIMGKEFGSVQFSLYVTSYKNRDQNLNIYCVTQIFNHL